VDIDERAQNCLIPKMLIQPLVENYFKHGFHAVRKQGTIRITAAYLSEERQLKVIVQDNGAGMTDARMEQLQQAFEQEHLIRELKGMGLANTNNRLKLYYGQLASLKLEHTPDGGLTVIVVLPANRNDSKGEAFGQHEHEHEFEHESDFNR